MTGIELQEYFGTHLNQFDSRLAPDSTDIFYWLTKAQLDMVRKAVSEFETNPMGSEIVRAFRREVSYPMALGGKRGKAVMTFTTIAPMLCYLTSRSTVFYNKKGITLTPAEPGDNSINISSDYVVKYADNRLLKGDDAEVIFNDPFHKPRANSPLVDLMEGVLTAYGDSTFIVPVIVLDAVLVPENVTVESSSSLPDHLHTTLVELAATMFLANTRGIKEKLQRETPTG